MSDSLPPAGWYPDPGGDHDRYRFWNGQSWEPQTRPAPPTAGFGPASTRRRSGLMVLIAAVAVALVVLTSVVVRGVLVSPAPRTIPVLSPAPASSRPAATPSPTAETACPPGNPTKRSAHPNDDRVYGGDLSFPALPARQWADNPLERFPVGYDISGQSQQPNLPHFAILAVGALPIEDFSSGPQNAARTVLGCMLTTAYVGTVIKTDIVSNRRVSVDGATGWSIQAKVSTDDPYAEGGGQLIRVIALETPQPEALSFFYGAVWIGDDERVAILDLTVRSLEVG